MSGDTQSRHCLWLMLVVSLAHIADARSGGVGHSRRVSSVIPDRMVFPSGLTAAPVTPLGAVQRWAHRLAGARVSQPHRLIRTVGGDAFAVGG
jgi:hypothetical protein